MAIKISPELLPTECSSWMSKKKRSGQGYSGRVTKTFIRSKKGCMYYEMMSGKIETLLEVGGMTSVVWGGLAQWLKMM